jgi:hypothetical protein
VSAGLTVGFGACAYYALGPCGFETCSQLGLFRIALQLSPNAIARLLDGPPKLGNDLAEPLPAPFIGEGFQKKRGRMTPSLSRASASVVVTGRSAQP